ncbi:MAG TPA: transaldolase [Gammaproteobacteria bacterium]|nr:transaldolase [Gammaproteobacteria bacterium]
MNPLLRLQEYGQSIWYDNIHRDLLTKGELAQMIREDGLGGVTSNPTIFEKAISGSPTYDQALRKLLAGQPTLDDQALFFELAMEDIRMAADLLLPVYRNSVRGDGMVSLEVSPDLAFDTEGTVQEARRLFRQLDRPNVMIKVPATEAGLPAIETLIAEGINVNVTLLFSIDRYREVAEAYLLGLESLLRRGRELSSVHSVASFFVSRVDSRVDALLETRLAQTASEEEGAALRALQGKAAIANAKLAYQAYLEIYGGERFARLREAGALPQRLLWASTGTKNPAYSDVLYVDALIGPETVNTVPPATYAAYKDHGDPRPRLTEDVEGARRVMRQLAEAGIDMDAITADLEEEGVRLFAESFHTLLAGIGEKRRALVA